MLLSTLMSEMSLKLFLSTSLKYYHDSSLVSGIMLVVGMDLTPCS